MKASCTALVLGLALCASPVAAQYPERTIEFVIPFDAGGSADIEGRLLAEEMSAVLGVTVAPVNRPGAGGALAYSYVNDAEPDGYTVMWTSHVDPHHYQSRQRALRLRCPRSHRTGRAPTPGFRGGGRFAVERHRIAGPGLRRRERPIRIANSGTGSTTHLGALAVMRAIGCEAVHLPIGTRRRNATVLSGEADAMVAPLTGALNLYRAGRLNLLATLGTERNAIIPDVPTAIEHGIDVEFDLFRGLSVPKGTPADVRARLAEAMTLAGSSEAFQRLADDLGLTVAPLTMDPFEALLQRENDRVRSIIQSDGTLTR